MHRQGVQQRRTAPRGLRRRVGARADGRRPGAGGTTSGASANRPAPREQARQQARASREAQQWIRGMDRDRTRSLATHQRVLAAGRRETASAANETTASIGAFLGGMGHRRRRPGSPALSSASRPPSARWPRVGRVHPAHRRDARGCRDDAGRHDGRSWPRRDRHHRQRCCSSARSSWPAPRPSARRGRRGAAAGGGGSGALGRPGETRRLQVSGCSRPLRTCRRSSGRRRRASWFQMSQLRNSLRPLRVRHPPHRAGRWA